jgi:hypothetical protein
MAFSTCIDKLKGQGPTWQLWQALKPPHSQAMADPLQPDDGQVTIPVGTGDDDDDDANDSAYGEEIQSLTTSLASSIWDYHYENGRRYNAFRRGTYW